MRFAVLLISLGAFSADMPRLVRTDHFVKVKSTAPSMAGQTAQIYVREVAPVDLILRESVNSVVLFVHGAGTPAEVAFDVPYKDYSWMAYLARHGFDTFSMDMTGYGRSTRPYPMNDPCNLSAEQQTQLFGRTCSPSSTAPVTTLDSDWNDIGAVVDYLRALRGVEKVSLVGWSLRGPRAGGYAAKNSGKVASLVLLAPAYNRGGVSRVDARPVPFNSQSRADLDANWNRQLGCPDQFEMQAREVVWTEMLASDPVGATWGPGVRRAPNVAVRDWNPEVVGKMKIPALFVAPAHDKQALPERVKDLYTDYGGENKVLLNLPCGSHNALWERVHLTLFQASLDWFTKNELDGTKNGVVRK
jgi:pimeloyl-ACP methyl ester carboxylesterase